MSINFREFYEKQERKVLLRKELEGLKESLSILEKQALMEVKKEVADNMKKQYGDNWKEVYYATANKQGRDPETWEKVKECDICGCEEEETKEELEEAKKKKKKQIKAPYEGSERSGNKHLPPPQKRIRSEKEKQKSRSRRKASDRREMDEGEKGLWDNIHAKKKRGEKPAKPGDEDYPDEESWEKSKMKEGGKCTGPTKKASSTAKGKKWMKCVKGPDGEGYKRVHWGQKGVNNKLV